MIDNNLFYKLQSGFLPNHNTVYQLIEIYHRICLNREQNLHTCMVFFDVSKAFDRVWHRGLLIKLQSYGFSGLLLNFIENYLTNRQQSVFVNNSFSSFLETTAGVPQGSVLGPFLFLIFINDIADNLLSVALLFADDTSLLHAAKRINDIERTLNSDLDKINEWSNKWLINFNPSKTEVLLISNRETENIALDFGGTALQKSNTHKHLGITFSSDGKWSTHIKNLCDAAYKKINVLNKLKYVLSRKSLDKIYNTFILPTLEYASEVWDGCSEGDSYKLEKIHHQAARIVTGLPLYTSIDSLYLETGWMSLKERREYKKLNLFYKIHNRMAPDYILDILPHQIQGSTPYNLRRHDSDYRIPNYRLRSSTLSFLPSSITLWNSLNPDIRERPTLNQFKYSLKRKYRPDPVPSHFLVGNRKYNVILTRLRNCCSSLNADLFRINLTNTPSCSCGSQSEDVFHFLFECPKFNLPRTIFLRNLSQFGNLSAEDILYGSELQNPSNNVSIQMILIEYIKATHRF
ncbi:hypothetical protein FSP39_012409 [Pinctada imbricata]|uniref:Reverse transcriptase domain-containing protein n=1 Tax=Pinctada imbricata TaxID=66713 RepID=A0AA88XCQ1_PINIB|nr:hypothetical protein FSP39_012409 [Pinctada imbricata]